MQISGFASGPYQTNCYLLHNEGQVVVIDPGMHTHDRVLEFLRETGGTLSAIVLTHGHIDHTRDAGQLARRLTTPVYIHPEDAFMLEGERGVSENARVLFDSANITPIEDLRHLHAGEHINLAGMDLEISHAPGHSPGSVLLHTPEICFSGDVLFKGAIGRTDFPDSDPEAMTASLRGPVLAMGDQVQVLPGHGAATTMRAERLSNPFLQGLTPA